METVIKARLSVALRLVDATTGRAMDSMEVKFMKNGLPVKPLYRGDATWIFLGDGREDFQLQVSARDYEDAQIDVCFEKLSEKLPMCDAFLIPSENNRRGGQVLGIRGTYTGLEAIDAVYLSRPLCMYRDTVVKRGIITMNLFPSSQGAKALLEEGDYVLLAEDGKCYEDFTVVKAGQPNAVTIREKLSRPYRADCRIYRKIFGRASPDGSFILRGRDDGSDIGMLLRYRAEGKTFFRKLDLHSETGEVDLSEGAWEAPAAEPEGGDAPE